VSIGVTSNSQFSGGGVSNYGLPQPVTAPISPLSLSSKTAGSANARTAWRTQDANSRSPMAYSSRTSGTTISFDDGGTTPKVEIK